MSSSATPESARASFRTVLVAPMRNAALSLDNRNFRLFWLTNSFFFIAQGLILMGAQWLMLSLTDSRSLLGLIGTIQGLVVLGLSPIGGVLADRLSRRNVLIICRGGLAAVMLVMTLLVFTDRVQVWHILVAVVFSGAGLAFTQTATQTYVFDIVGRERLTNAIALNSLATAIFQIISPSIGGTLLALIGPQGTYLSGAIGFSMASAILLFIPLLGRTHSAKHAGAFLKTTLEDAGEGFVHMWRDPALRWLIAFGLITFCGGAVIVLRPVFAKELLNVGASGLGWLGTSFGVGALLSGLVMAALGSRVRYLGLALLLGQTDWMACQVLYSFSHSFALSLVLEFMLGVSVPFLGASAIAIIQLRVPAELRNRVLTVYFMLITLINVSWWVTGRLADWLGDREALFLMGALGLGLNLFVLVVGRQLSLIGSKQYPIQRQSAPG